MANGRSSKQKVDGQIACSSEALGDPAPGVPKQCICQSNGLKMTPKAKKCAKEGESCSCKGNVFYGFAPDGKFEQIFRSPTGAETYAVKKILAGDSMKCDTSEFGDVAFGKPKTCFCDETKAEVYKMEKEFVAEKCADEGGQCNCTTTIHYGKLGEDFADMMMLPHKTKEVTGAFKNKGFMSCSADTFGDPIPGSKKQCFCERQSKPLGGPIDNKTESVRYCGSEGEKCQCQGRVFYGKEFDESKPAPVNLDPIP
jgi:hypothetical protein